MMAKIKKERCRGSRKRNKQKIEKEWVERKDKGIVVGRERWMKLKLQKNGINMLKGKKRERKHGREKLRVETEEKKMRRKEEKGKMVWRN